MKTNAKVLKTCGNIVFSTRGFAVAESNELKGQYDAIIVGGGHNGLTAVSSSLKMDKS